VVQNDGGGRVVKENYRGYTVDFQITAWDLLKDAVDDPNIDIEKTCSTFSDRLEAILKDEFPGADVSVWIYLPEDGEVPSDEGGVFDDEGIRDEVLEECILSATGPFMKAIETVDWVVTY
jgi:hypothetical protein